MSFNKHSHMSVMKECVGTSRNFSRSQLDEIARQVEMDAGSLIFALLIKGFDLDSLDQIYDEDDEQYRNENRDEETAIDY